MKGQFFIITAVLVAGLLFSTTTMLASSQTIDYSTVLEDHSTDIMENVVRESRSAWWDLSWGWRKRVIVEERSGLYLENEAVSLSLDAKRSRVNDTCADIRVVSEGGLRRWKNITPCNIETYKSNTSALGRWKLDRGEGGTAEDSTGSGYDGEFQGGPEWVSGRFGSGLRFGGDDLVEVPGFPEMDGSFTATAWVRSTGSGTVVADDDNDNGWYITVESGEAVFEVRGENQISGGNVEEGRWHHVAGVMDVDSGEQVLYLDGRAVASASAGSPPTDSGPLTFGGQGTGQGLEGSLDDIRVYGRALSPGEVEGIAKNGIGLNVSVDLSPREKKVLQVYYGNPGAEDPGYDERVLSETYMDERPITSVGMARGVREVVRKLQNQVRRLDASVGASVNLEFRRECNLITLDTPSLSLRKELC